MALATKQSALVGIVQQGAQGSNEMRVIKHGIQGV